MSPKNNPTILFISLLAAACSSDVAGYNSPDGGGTEPDAESELPALLCGDLNADLESVTPTVMLLVDRSGSMETDFGGESRWKVVGETLVGTGGIVPRYEDEVRFGASFFTTDINAGICPFLEDVPPALNNYSLIKSDYESKGPLGHTPTGESLELALESIEGVTEKGPKVIVLATDGLPDTCAIPTPNATPSALNRAVGAAENAFQAGVATFIISVGPDVARDHLQDMANAGAGVATGDPNAPFYVALDTSGLQDSFDTIVNGVRHCTFPIDRIGTSGEEGLEVTGGVVLLDGVELVEGTEWRSMGDDTVLILGDACEALKKGDHLLEGSFTCSA